MKTMLLPALALAALAAPIAPALATAPTAVQYSDLDLDSEAGKATLDARIRNAARRICDSEHRTGTRISSSACLDDVRQQVLAKLEQQQNRVGKGG